MASVFNNTASGLDTLVSDMMQGNNLAFSGGTPLILDVLAGGGWVNSDVITSPKVSITALTTLLQKDLLQRGINFIWSQSKIYVTFADLKDDAQMTKCKADVNGWQPSKTCADGGVYYLYRFNEDGNLDGNLDYPWGADKMTEPPWNLNPAVSSTPSPISSSKPAPSTNTLFPKVGNPLLSQRLPLPKQRRRRLRLRLHQNPHKPPLPLRHRRQNRLPLQPQRPRRRLEHLRLRHGHARRLERRFHADAHSHSEPRWVEIYFPVLLRAAV